MPGRRSPRQRRRRPWPPRPSRGCGLWFPLPELLDRLGREEVEAQLSGGLQIALVVERTAHADLNRPLRPQEALLDRAPEDGAVIVFLAEVGIPGISVT